ncbi:uncharacterized protein LOC106673055 isoform X1 [Cimex lectularius]|uniref:Uncharacterized protein n=1 Tax=Cimex lectularius TaxID=79782 RepID=A0A8I6SNH3_CIMLE|nr:uncharacterized protein LOC106673055 isoform X1 [Cimex lectularius]
MNLDAEHNKISYKSKQSENSKESGYRIKCLRCVPSIQSMPKGKRKRTCHSGRVSFRQKNRGRLRRIPIGTKGISKAFEHWLTSAGMARFQKQGLSELVEAASSAASSQKLLLQCMEKQKRVQSKEHVDVKPFTPTLWANVVNNVVNYVDALKSISDLLFPYKVVDYSDCGTRGSSLVSFDWGNYLIYISNLITSAETIKQLLQNGEVYSHCRSHGITGIVGLTKSDWGKLFVELDSVITISKNLEYLVVQAHGIPLVCIINSFPPPPGNIDWVTFFKECDRLNLSAKNVLNFLYSIFFLNDSLICENSDSGKPGAGIYEEISKRCFHWENGECDFNEHFSGSTEKTFDPVTADGSKCDSDSTTGMKNRKSEKNSFNYISKGERRSSVRPIFLNKVQENRSKARVAWIHPKYNIIDLKKRADRGILHKSSEAVKDGLENSKIVIPVAYRKTPSNVKGKHFIRRHTSYTNLPEAKTTKYEYGKYVDNGISALVPLHRYVSCLVLNLLERNEVSLNQRNEFEFSEIKETFCSPNSNGSLAVHPAVRRISKRTNVTNGSKHGCRRKALSETKIINGENSKIFENPIPERRSVIPRVVLNDPRIFAEYRKLLNQVNSSEMSQRSVIFKNTAKARPSIPLSSLSRDHPLLIHAQFFDKLKKKSEISIQKSCKNYDFQHKKTLIGDNRIINYCMLQKEQNNDIKDNECIETSFVPPSNHGIFEKKSQEFEAFEIPNCKVDLQRIESFLKSGLRQNKLKSIMEEIHLETCQCATSEDGIIHLISLLLGEQCKIQPGVIRLKDYNAIMIKLFKFVYPTALVKSVDGKDIQLGPIRRDDLTQHLVSLSDEEVGSFDREMFTTILTGAEERFKEGHRVAQHLASRPSMSA